MPQRTLQGFFPSKPFPEAVTKGFFISTQGEPPSGFRRVAFFNIGAPNLRTIWEIQNIIVEFALEIQNNKTEEKIQLKIEALAGNVTVAITTLEFKLPGRIKFGEPSITQI